MEELKISIDNPEELLFHSIKNRIEYLVGRIPISSHIIKIDQTY